MINFMLCLVGVIILGLLVSQLVIGLAFALARVLERLGSPGMCRRLNRSADALSVVLWVCIAVYCVVVYFEFPGNRYYGAAMLTTAMLSFAFRLVDERRCEINYTYRQSRKTKAESARREAGSNS